MICAAVLSIVSQYVVTGAAARYGMVWYGMVWYGMVWYVLMMLVDCLLGCVLCSLQRFLLSSLLGRMDPGRVNWDVARSKHD